MNIIEVFRAGQIPELNEAVMREVVDNYDPSDQEAPLVLGHPEDNQPAYGWIKQVFTKGKRMFAAVDEIDPAVTDMVRKGAYKHVSVSFYTPTATQSPLPGKWCLRHVGLLGAEAPAIKGMEKLQLAELSDNEEDVIIVDMNEDDKKGLLDRFRKFLGADAGKRDLSEEDLFRALADAWKKKAPDDIVERIEQMGATQKVNWLLNNMADFMGLERDEAIALLKQDSQTDAQEENMSEADKAKLDALQKENAELKKAQAEAGRAAIVKFAEEQVAAGKVLPKDKSALVETLVSLKGREDGGVVSLSEGADKTDLADWLKTQIAGQPATVDYSERAGAGDERRERAAHAARVKAADNLPVDETRLALHNEAMSLSESMKIPYEDAVRQVEQRTTH